MSIDSVGVTGKALDMVSNPLPTLDSDQC